MKDRFFRGRQIAFMIHEYLRVTGAHEVLVDYSDLFRITLHRDSFHDFDTRWDEVVLSSVSQVLSKDILESL